MYSALVAGQRVMCESEAALMLCTVHWWLQQRVMCESEAALMLCTVHWWLSRE